MIDYSKVKSGDIRVFMESANYIVNRNGYCDHIEWDKCPLVERGCCDRALSAIENYAKQFITENYIQNHKDIAIEFARYVQDNYSQNRFQSSIASDALPVGQMRLDFMNDIYSIETIWNKFVDIKNGDYSKKYPKIN